MTTTRGVSDTLVQAAFFTSLGVRLRQIRRTPGVQDWLLFPGPGFGSESLLGLAAADLPGTTWLVDLPGDGSNTSPPGAPVNPYVLWPQVLLEAADAVPAPIAVGHSTGGEFLLSVPALEHRLRGLVLISSAPDRGWIPTFQAMGKANPIPEVTAATETYDRNPSAINLRKLAVASAPWNFTTAGLEEGRALLEQLRYNPAAADWSSENFEPHYISSWWPTSLPTLIISGSHDRVVDQNLWHDPYYRGPHIQHLQIDAAGHYPWIEQPAAVQTALHQLNPLR